MNIGDLFWKKGQKTIKFASHGPIGIKINKTKKRLKQYGKQIKLYNGWWEQQQQQQNQASLTNVFSKRDYIECCSYEQTMTHIFTCSFVNIL